LIIITWRQVAIDAYKYSMEKELRRSCITDMVYLALDGQIRIPLTTPWNPTSVPLGVIHL